MKNENEKYYLGLDIGTDSVGYAVTDEQYNLKKFHGEPAWGSHIFDAASLSAERRTFRTSRRRLDRRQQRIVFLQELFAKEINTIDSKFFKRLQASFLLRNETEEPFTLFNDDNYTDKEYYNQYPTIHHLICELMNSTEPHDVRLVYLACMWLVAHRGHFLSNISFGNIDKISDFKSVYEKFILYFKDNGYDVPWECGDIEKIGEILKKNIGITAKNKELVATLFEGKKPSKTGREEFPFSTEAIIKLMAGGTCKIKELFCKDEYEEYGSVSLSMDDDKMGEIMSNIGEDFDLISTLRSLYDWAILVDILNDSQTISEAKVKIYDQHKKDLAFLKYIIKKYKPVSYNEIFRDTNEKIGNYVAYVYHTNDGDTSTLKKVDKENFSKYLLGLLKNINPLPEDKEKFDFMIGRLELRTFMPKQKDTNNRVVPYQLYWFELNKILKNAEVYLPFLKNRDEDDISTSEKIESIFLFKVPYFVGPLNTHSNHAWLERKAGKIYPWNFEQIIDLDKSEQNFIQRMTNTCTYLPGEPVLPKDSLLYHKYMVLNEINNLKINGQSISVELKQSIYKELFLKTKKITRKKLVEYLICNGYINKSEDDSVSGIDVEIKSNLTPQIAFKQLLENGIISEDDAEKIIERSSYAEDKNRLSRWLEKEYPNINEADRKYICGLKINDFGRLSRMFLNELEGADKETGEVTTIISALWNTNYNLMELLSDKFTFMDEINAFRNEFYSEHAYKLDDKLNEMYVSNDVKRPVYRTLDIINDVYKAFGAPSKIFVEMTRGADPNQKGKRTKTRKEQILELYAKCKEEDVRLLKKQLEDMGEYCDNRLQGDKLFLYYMQLGKSMYSEKPIDLNKLGTKEYDIDHIYPQAYVKDDSIINNKVLVLSSENGEKKDVYPIKEEIRQSMCGYWNYLKNVGLISEEKYKRLTRNTPFTADEKWGFINRQLTETSQSTKAVARLLKERFPDVEIVYCKARLTSEFRQEFDLLKSRTFNDLHHAADAYLNIVTGNVYNMKFTKKWFNVDTQYSIKTKTLFSHKVTCNGQMVWDGPEMLAKVKNTVGKGNAHFTKYSYFKRGGFFDQMPVKASEGLVPLKKELDTEKYGGYNKAGAMFYIPTRYKLGKKLEIIIMSVELLYGKKFLEDEGFAREYAFARIEHITGKKVDDVDFPMGMRSWKVNTVLSLDGFRVCIAGIASGGKCLIAQPIMQFKENVYWQIYIKRLESFTDKCNRNSNYIYDEEFDKVSELENIRLYDIYINKLNNTIFSKRVNNPVRIIEEGKGKFLTLDIKQQTQVLLNIHQVFGRVAGGCDLTNIGGSKHAAATVSFSSTISNWKKNYSEVCVIDVSASGLWEKKSENLLNLL